jgi:hypothetical protein
LKGRSGCWLSGKKVKRSEIAVECKWSLTWHLNSPRGLRGLAECIGAYRAIRRHRNLINTGQPRSSICIDLLLHLSPKSPQSDQIISILSSHQMTIKTSRVDDDDGRVQRKCSRESLECCREVSHNNNAPIKRKLLTTSFSSTTYLN